MNWQSGWIFWSESTPCWPVATHSWGMTICPSQQPAVCWTAIRATRRLRRQYADSLVAVGRLTEASREYEQLVGMYGEKVPVDVLKRSFSLRFVEAVRKSDKQSRAWEQLETSLNVLERSVPNDDPWVPLMKAEFLAQKR